MIAKKQYNRVYNALNTAQAMNVIDAPQWQRFATKIDFARTENELAEITREITSLINVNKHSSKAQMVKSLKSKGWRLLNGSDTPDTPLQKYVYQNSSGLYKTEFAVEL